MLCFTQHRLADEFGRIQQAQCHAGIPAFWCTPVLTPERAPVVRCRTGEAEIAGDGPDAAVPVQVPVQERRP